MMDINHIIIVSLSTSDGGNIHVFSLVSWMSIVFGIEPHGPCLLAIFHTGITGELIGKP